MEGVVADTHAVIWYLSGSNRLSASARLAMRQANEAGVQVYLSVITLVEVVYLVEKGRLPESALARLKAALAEENSAFGLVALDAAVAYAIQRIDRRAVPDMPDRIIAATALYLDLPLVSRDEKLRAASIHTIW